MCCLAGPSGHGHEVGIAGQVREFCFSALSLSLSVFEPFLIGDQYGSLITLIWNPYKKATVTTTTNHLSNKGPYFRPLQDQPGESYTEAWRVRTFWLKPALESSRIFLLWG